jgi:leader peptidase (prepilin peptidase)/N-methyltransferase
MLPLLGGLAGLVAGSFIALVTLRWPQGRSIMGRSACDHCGHQLGVAELLPVISFLALRGRCRHCGGAIAPRHLWIELAAALVGALALAGQPGGAGAVTALISWWLLAIIILDAEHFWLPDTLTLPLLAMALARAWPDLAAPALAALLGWAGLAGLALAYRRLRGRDGLGGGDPKLLAGLGALLGVQLLPLLLVGAGLLGLALLGWDKARGRAVTATTRLPLGALLAGVALLTLLVRPLLPA